MGWHHVTDNQCSLCQYPRRTDCALCKKNLCRDCIYHSVGKGELLDQKGKMVDRVKAVLDTADDAEDYADTDERFQALFYGDWDYESKRPYVKRKADLCEPCYERIHPRNDKDPSRSIK